jgi:hypothetical protein
VPLKLIYPDQRFQLALDRVAVCARKFRGVANAHSSTTQPKYPNCFNPYVRYRTELFARKINNQSLEKNGID